MEQNQNQDNRQYGLTINSRDRRKGFTIYLDKEQAEIVRDNLYRDNPDWISLEGLEEHEDNQVRRILRIIE